MPVTTREAWVAMRVQGLKIPSDLRQIQKKFDKAGQKTGQTFGAGLAKGIGKRLKRIGGTAAKGVGGGLLAGFAVGGRDAVAFESTIEDISVQIEASAEKTAELRKQLTAVSKATGIDRGEFAKGVAVLGDKIGAAGVTEEQITLLGRAMQASGGDAEVLAGLMQTLQITLGQTGDKAEQSLSQMLAIGKAASIPLAELAQSAPSLISIAKSSGVGSDELGRLIATAQRLEPVFGEGSTAAKALEDVMGAIGNRGAEIEKVFGIEVFSKKNGVVEQKKAFEVLREILPQIAKDGRKVKEAFGRKKGINLALKQLAGKEVQRDIDALVAKGGNLAQIEDDIARRRASGATQLKTAFNNLKLAFAEPFTPEAIESVTAGLKHITDGINLSISGWKRFKGLFDENSNDRNLLRDEGTAGIAKAGLSAGLDVANKIAGTLPIGMAARAVGIGQGERIFGGDEGAQTMPANVIRERAAATEKRIEQATFKGMMKALRLQPIRLRKESGAPALDDGKTDNK